jgi:hypothetical protein
MYSKGDTLVLGEREATRSGDTGTVVPSGSMHAVRARAESGRGANGTSTLRDVEAHRGPGGLREVLGPQLPPPYRHAVVAAVAAVAHKPYVLLRAGAAFPGGDVVVEPHSLLASTQDTPSVIPPPHVHLHPCSR